MAFIGVRGRQLHAREHIGLYVWVSFLGIIVIGAVGFVLHFPFFYYRSVEISGETRIPRADLLADLRAYPLKTFMGRLMGFNHFFLWGTSPITLPEFLLQRVEVSRDVIHRTLCVAVTDRERALIWCDNDRCVWVDPEGVAFQYAPFAEGQLITAITESMALPLLGNAVLPEDQFRQLRRVVALVQESGLLVQRIALTRPLEELTVDVQNGPTLAFSLRFDPSFAATALTALTARKDFRHISAIDFRVERKAYYSLRGVAPIK